MKILLTNDDGYSAKGINALFRRLSTEHEVYMVAPFEEKSACSNAITIWSDLTLREHQPKIFSVSGYPADCTNVGLHAGIIPEVDIVVSGINHGANLGDDVHYSGTVAGARVGFIHGKSAIAVSLCTKTDLDMIDDAAEYAARFIKRNEIALVEERIFLNINYPAIPIKDLAGQKYAYMDTRRYSNRYVVSESTQGQKLVRLDGSVELESPEGSDTYVVKKGYVSITPLSIDSTDYAIMDQMEEGGII